VSQGQQDLAPEPAPNALALVPGIDGLRGLAILFVLFNHATEVFASGDRLQTSWFWRCSPGAWLGVDLFFVVSGFLITNILLSARSRPRPFRTFLIRRALRIFPLAFLYLAVLIALGFFWERFAVMRHPSTIAWITTYLINYRIAFKGWHLAEVSILWSLAVEEQFYAGWPLLALKLPLRFLGRLLVVVVIVTPLIRWEIAPRLGSAAVYVLTITRWDALAAGALLALAWRSPARPAVLLWSRRLLVPSIVVIAVMLGVPFGPENALHPRWFDAFGYSLVAGAFFVWTGVALDPRSRLQVVLSSRVLRYLGKRCYGLYIWHILTGMILRTGLERLGLVWSFELQVLVWVGFLVAVAAASFRFFEEPFLRLKDRFAA
jgi:peptidoglycan/LPS O-acetylase OafA/YrhL